ncbi:hypothetical protein VN0561_04090 [Helicobacter pylori]
MLNKCMIGFLKAKFERNNLGFSMSVEIFKIAKKHSIKKNLHQVLLEWIRKNLIELSWSFKIFRNLSFILPINSLSHKTNHK